MERGKELSCLGERQRIRACVGIGTPSRPGGGPGGRPADTLARRGLLDAVWRWFVDEDPGAMRELFASSAAFPRPYRSLLEALGPLLRPGGAAAPDAASELRRTGRAGEAELLEDLIRDCEPPRGERDAGASIAAGADSSSDGAGASDGAQAGPSGRESASSAIVRLARDLCRDLYHDEGGKPYADVVVRGRRLSLPLESRSFRQLLVKEYYDSTGAVPHHQALRESIAILTGAALFDGPQRRVHLRVAADGGDTYVDLGDEEGFAARISPGSWQVVDDPPVRFRRPGGMLPLPLPVRGGSTEELRPFVNVSSEAESDWRLLVAWLTFSLTPRGPFPVLSLHGEQGSAKSTTARVLRSLVDPGKAALRAEPRDLRDFAIASESSWLVAFDNLSGVQRWLSDALCRLATGGGFATRELYTDRDEAIFDAVRPVILTGIEEVASSGDLLDRSILLTLPPIAESARRDEGSLWRSFEEARPRILGALFQAVADALRWLPEVRPERLPRMADFARWGHAVERALGWPEGSFRAAYRESRVQAAEIALDSSPVASALLAFLGGGGGGGGGEWKGPCKDLLRALEASAHDGAARRRGWPRTPRSLSGEMRRLAPALRSAGVEVEFGRAADRGHTRFVRARRVG